MYIHQGIDHIKHFTWETAWFHTYLFFPHQLDPVILTHGAWVTAWFHKAKLPSMVQATPNGHFVISLVPGINKSLVT